MKRVARCILSVNAGSSSLKLGLWRCDEGGEQRLARVKAEGIGQAESTLTVEGPRDERSARRVPRKLRDHMAALRASLALLAEHPAPDAAGHRIVHGGETLAAPTRLDARTRKKLRALVSLAPLHLPAELDLIEMLGHERPRLPQVACFDTSFHRDLPAEARLLPLPKKMRDAGLRRYGFHGLSYESIAARLSKRALRRAIFCHLGSGSSMVAVQEGRSVDTTMGFTPSGGIMMGTRPGDLDPGLLLYWLARDGDLSALERALDQQSGLRGVSETSSDMAKLLKARRQDPRAAQAVELYAYGVRKQIGAYVAALGGLDTLVFSGGIGERAAEVRALSCRGLEVLGVALDARKNAAHAQTISRGAVRVHVLPADEERMLARHTARVLGG